MPSAGGSDRPTRLRSSSVADRGPGKGAYPGQVRIIAGKWRGRLLQIIDSPGFRPTPNRVRETLFNWLQADIPGSRCLDLFAGSGALCLEALSRGAQEVVMVEKDPAVARNLGQNVEMLKAEGARVVPADALAYLAGEPRAFEIVFVDPPFKAREVIGPILNRLQEAGWLAADALVYVEAPSDLATVPTPGSWRQIRSKTTGQVGYHLYLANPAQDPS